MEPAKNQIILNAKNVGLKSGIDQNIKNVWNVNNIKHGNVRIPEIRPNGSDKQSINLCKNYQSILNQ